MLSKYFEMVTGIKKFDDDLLWSMGEIKNKKVIIYGAGEEFVALNKIYKFNEVLNVVAIADMKFEQETIFEGFKAINPDNIEDEDFDIILISNENPAESYNFITEGLFIENKEIRSMFNPEIKEENVSYNYLAQFNFSKHLGKLNKKLKNKSIIIYGAGIFFEAIKKYYDLSKLNIIGLSDRRFSNHAENEEYLGYKVYSPEEIREVNPDYVLVATKFFIEIIEDLQDETLNKTKIKVKPLMKKPLLTILKEFWEL